MTIRLAPARIRWAAGLFAIGMVMAAAGAYRFALHPKRPKYIFINETADHRHDLALKASLVMAERKSGIENALVLVAELPGSRPIEDVARSYFERFDIGRARGGKGLLYLYSKKENRFKIEVSYALEGNFPDAMVHRLENAAQTYMLSEVPQDFLSELLITMNINGAEHTAETSDFSSPEWAKSRYLSGGAGAVENLYSHTLADLQSAIAKLDVTDREKFQPSQDVNATLERYLNSLGQGMGDPNLPLLTEGSQIFRWNVPRNVTQQKRVYDYYQKAMPYQLIVNGSFAVAVFRRGVANLPIVLRHGTDGFWYVDEPKAWTWFHRFEDDVDFYPKYAGLPVSLDSLAPSHPHVLKPILKRRSPAPVPPTYPFRLHNRAAELEKVIAQSPQDVRARAALGDFYLFEMNWIRKAIEHFEQAAALNPHEAAYKWRLWELYTNDSRPEKALEQLSELAKKFPGDREIQQWSESYHRAYAFEAGDF